MIAFWKLRGLHLDGVALNYLQNWSALGAPPPEVSLALGRLQAERGELTAALLTVRGMVLHPSELEFSSLPREIWHPLYPPAYWQLVRQQSSRHGVNPYVVMGLIRQESAFNPQATSPADARGLMQILPRTASPNPRRRAAVARRLFEPTYNVRVGCQYLRGRLKRFGGSVEQALAAYHAGDSRVLVWLATRSYEEPAEFVESIPVTATRVYVKSILRDANIYRQLMTGQATFARCPTP